MLVINGLHDETVLPEWVTKAVARSCRLGHTIDRSGSWTDSLVPRRRRIVRSAGEESCW